MKTHYLNGKRNRHVDHIVKTLVKDLMSNVSNLHKRQVAGLEGLDLEGTRRQQILATASSMSADSIHHVGGTKFNVASQSNPGHCYAINLTQSTCDCNDFPRIRHCKHIAAIRVHFPQLCAPSPSCANGSGRSAVPERVRAPDRPNQAPRSEEDGVDILLKDIYVLCHELSAVTDHATLDLQVLKSVKYSLKAAVASADGSRALPEKDVFNPNQKTWAETAERMGVRKASKRKQRPVGGDTNTERCIGAVKGKRTRKISDPYAGGERSGKRAKPDAVSAVANEQARTVAPTPAVHSRAVLARAHASPSAAAGGSAARPLTRANPSGAIPLAYPPSSTVPGFAFSRFPAAPPRRAFAPHSAAIPGLAHTVAFDPTCFRGEMMPGKGRARFSPGPPST